MQFLFTDLEQSTARWTLAPDLMCQIVRLQKEVAGAVAAWGGGRFVKSTGDGVFCVFQGHGVASALEFGRRWEEEAKGLSSDLRVRVAVAAGEALECEGDFFGSAVNRAARLVSAAWGGQVVVTERALCEEEGLGSVAIRDLGFHTFGDMGPPERVFQVSDTRCAPIFPPLRRGVVRAYSIPTPRGPFVGRAELLAEVCQLICAPGMRVLSLVGPGGVGKTRLALEAASRVAPTWEWGASLVPMRGIDTPGMAWWTLAEVLHVPSPGPQAQAEVLRFLGDKHILLVLDDTRPHLAEGFVSPLVERCMGVRLMVTSRHPLGIWCERVVRVRGLPCPVRADDPAFLDYDAVKCFCVYASGRGWEGPLTPGEREAVHELCSLYEGIPLALELAASWVGTMSVAELAGWARTSPLELSHRLADSPPEHQSIRASVRASWEMLAPEARQLLGRLSLFSGSFSREAATWMAGGDAGLVASLVEVSLVKLRGDGRYELHPVVRPFVQEEAQREGKWHEHQRAFVAYWAGFIQAAAAGPGYGTLPPFEDDRQALCEALETARTQGDVASLAVLVPAVAVYYWECMRHQEGSDAMGRVLETLRGMPAGQEVEKAKVIASLAWGRFLLGCGQVDRSLGVLREVVRDAAAHGMTRQTWEAVQALGLVLLSIGQCRRASLLFRRAAKAFVDLNRPKEASVSYSLAGSCLERLGRAEEALSSHCLGVEWAVRSGCPQAQVYSLRGYGLCLLAIGDWQQALHALERGLQVARTAGSPRQLTGALQVLGEVYAETGNLSRAKACLEEALAIRRQLGEQAMAARSLGFLARVANEEGDSLTALRLSAEGLALAQDACQDEAAGVCGAERALALLRVSGPQAARGAMGEVLAKAFRGELRLAARAVLVDARILWAEGEREAAWALASSLARQPPSPPLAAQARALMAEWGPVRPEGAEARELDWRLWRGKG